MTLTFPTGFVWGTATAAYQIEGAADLDGRAPSIWDIFCRVPGAVANGDTGDVACDHYHRYVEDVALMRDLGMQGYRFSIAWPRVLPKGRGEVNQAGLDFYDRLVDELLKAGIEPFATLYHWDLPQALQDVGGWIERDTVNAFVEYADIVSRRLGDRVKNWITHNEPWVVSFLGHAIGMHAPGLKEQGRSLQVAHHLLLSHGMALPVLRTNGGQRCGITLNLTPVEPASESDEDQAAARRADGFFNRWYLDPIFTGQYPADMLTLYAGDAPVFTPADMNMISAPIDFLGVNYYTRSVVRANPEGRLFGADTVEQEGEHTAMDWEVYPDGLYNLLTRLKADYNDPVLYITENGAAFNDVLGDDGHVHDDRRTAYLQSHFAAAQRAIQDGVRLRGYFVWSFMDNFEWSFGYDRRFGIVYTDYPTQRRIPKDSALWYAQVIKENEV